MEAIRDLKDARFRSVPWSTEHVFVSSMAAYVGMDPRQDIRWLVGETSAEAMRAFSDGKADAFLGFAPQPKELRARKVGHVIVNTTHDRPWSQYFCCMLTGNREFVRKNPVATKRAIRAFLKAADICATQPTAQRGTVDKAMPQTTRWRWRSSASCRITLARSPPGGYDPVPRAASARGRDDQDQPEQAHRARYRLAFPERAEEELKA
jgi:ABC-type nitrate/sulfonate/bicarbonate transport system substrate-binding protein